MSLNDVLVIDSESGSDSDIEFVGSSSRTPDPVSALPAQPPLSDSVSPSLQRPLPQLVDYELPATPIVDLTGCSAPPLCNHVSVDITSDSDEDVELVCDDLALIEISSSTSSVVMLDDYKNSRPPEEGTVDIFHTPDSIKWRTFWRIHLNDGVPTINVNWFRMAVTIIHHATEGPMPRMELPPMPRRGTRIAVAMAEECCLKHSVIGLRVTRRLVLERTRSSCRGSLAAIVCRAERQAKSLLSGKKHLWLNLYWELPEWTRTTQSVTLGVTTPSSSTKRKKQKKRSEEIGGDLPIDKDNVGHQLLELMGWSPGQAIGTNPGHGLLLPRKAVKRLKRREGLV